MSNWYQALAREHGGMAKKFDMCEACDRYGDELAKKGVCTGYCLLFLSLEGTPGEGVHEQKLADTDPTLFFHANYAMGFIRQGELGQIAAKFGLVPLTAVNCSGENLGAVCLGGTGRLALILLEGHAVAYSNLGTGYVFFDPNFGYARFPDSLKFALFLQDFFKQAPYGKQKPWVWWIKKQQAPAVPRAAWQTSKPKAAAGRSLLGGHR